MALYSGRLLMRGGNESDFDPDKMMPREWAVSTDRKIVRICVSPGEVIRMATYDAFEGDMAKIENILKECQTIQEAVVRINAEVSQNADAVAEYTTQAKQYRDEAKISADNAKTSETNSKTSETNSKTSETNAKVSEEHAQAVFESLPEDYGTLSKEFYEVAIKQKASGEDIHVTDSANAKVREFALFGKAKQNTTSGNQLISNFTKNKWIQAGSGVVLDDNISIYAVSDLIEILPNEIYGFYTVGMATDGKVNVAIYDENEIFINQPVANLNGFKNFTTPTNAKYARCCSRIEYINQTYLIKGLTSGTAENYEPYTGGQPSPSPSYEQPVEVKNGDVVVNSCGKNVLKYDNDLSYTYAGVTVESLKDNLTFSFKGTSTNTSTIQVPVNVKNKKGIYIFNSTYKPTNNANVTLYYHKNGDTTIKALRVGEVIDLSENTIDKITFYFVSGVTFNEVVKIQLEKGTTSTDFEPYKETTATIPVTDFAGIPVSSGGNYTDQSGQQWICDEVVKYADGSGEKIQRVVKDIIKNFTSFNGPTGGGLYYSDVDTKKPFDSMGKETNIMCNFYSVQNGVIGWDSKEPCIISRINNISLRIHWQKDITTTEQAREFLANNEVIAYYILKEPIRTPLTAEQIAEIEKLHTFYPVTNISNDADCGMSVTYLCDSKNYIDSKIAELATAMVNSI